MPNPAHTKQPHDINPRAQSIIGPVVSCFYLNSDQFLRPARVWIDRLFCAAG